MRAAAVSLSQLLTSTPLSMAFLIKTVFATGMRCLSGRLTRIYIYKSWHNRCQPQGGEVWRKKIFKQPLKKVYQSIPWI